MKQSKMNKTLNGCHSWAFIEQHSETSDFKLGYVKMFLRKFC